MKIKLIRAVVALAVLLLVGSGAIAQEHRITARELVAEIQKQVGVEWKADTVESPKFVETLPKVGYRFMSRVEWVAEQSRSNPPLRVVPIGLRSMKVPLLADGEKRHQRASRRWPFATLGIGLPLTLAMGGYKLRSRPPASPDKLTITPFTIFPGFEIGPSSSPDGSQIIFAWFGYEKEFQFDLYVKQVGKERFVQLTHHPAIFLAAEWSPDRRSIAFMRQAEPEATGIYLISSLGRSERNSLLIAHRS
jgi:hypothetical protein